MTSDTAYTVEPQERPAQSAAAGGMPFERWELVAFGVIFLVALSMRLWDLGSRAFGYDESLHAYYSFRLAQGFEYLHNPLTHGPFQYHIMAAFYFLLGDSDYVSRLSHALFGAALVLLPLFLRQRLGRAGALATSLMLAFSPMMLFYSRYARNDIYMAVWTLALVVLLWRYVDEGKPRYLYLSAAVLALSFATKETTFIFVAILGSYLLIVAATDWIPWLLRQRTPTRFADPAAGGEYRYIPGVGFGYGPDPEPTRLSSFSRWGAYLVLLATLTAPHVSSAVSIFQDRLAGAGIILASSDGLVGAPSGDTLFTIQDVDITKGIVVALIVLVLILWFSTMVGITWNRRLWLRCAVVFYSIWLLLFTTFLTNMLGLGSGFWQSLGYWLAQHDVNRGDQPWYYYFVITPLYETLPVLLSVAAVIYYAFRGDSFTRFLAYWTVLTFALYSVAGEKMPWLVVNIALPMIVISGKLIGDMVAATSWARIRQARGVYLFPLAALLVYLVARLLLFDIQRGNVLNFLEFVTLLGFALVLVGLGVHLLLRSGAANGLRLTALSLALLLGVLSARAGWQATYVHGDEPIEMIVYAQDSGDVPRIIDRVREIAESSEEGYDMPLTVDKDAYWGMLWYIRDFNNAEYADLDNLTEAPQGEVVLISNNNRSKMTAYLDQYAPAEDFTYLWWPAEGYKPCGEAGTEPCFRLTDLFSNLVSKDKWREGLDYYIYRKTDLEFLTHDAVAFFPKEDAEE